MQLNEQEKEKLHSLITAFIGEDAAISAAKSGFTEETVSVVEQLITANLNCNDAMQSLVSDILSGGRVLATGWLRRSLGVASKAVKQSSFNGYGCRVTSKSRWKTDILVSPM